MNVEHITISEVFDKWYAYLRDNPRERYLHASRPEILQILVEYLIKYKIPYEEAKMYTRKVMEALTTPEGRKGKGKYSGWKEHVEQDYHAKLADYYIEGIKDDEREDMIQHSSSTPLKVDAIIDFNDPSLVYIEDPIVDSWGRHKFKHNWNDDIKKSVCLVGSYLNLQFINEVFGSDWAKGRGKLPDWMD